MAEQVRPWVTKPDKCKALRARRVDMESPSVFHWGQARRPRKGRMYGGNFTDQNLICLLAYRERPCMHLMPETADLMVAG